MMTDQPNRARATSDGAPPPIPATIRREVIQRRIDRIDDGIVASALRAI